MSREQMHHNPSLSHPFRIPSGGVPAYQPLHYTAAAAQHPFQVPDRQPSAHPGLRFPFNMPDLSSLTSSDLISALITPSAADYQQSRRAFPFPGQFSQPQFQHVDRSRPSKRARGDQAGSVDSPVESQRRSRAAPEKKTKKQQARKSSALPEVDDEYVEEDLAEEFDDSRPTKRRYVRRSTRPKKSPPPAELPTTFDEDDLISPPRETKPKRAPAVKKPKKERPGRLIRKKPIGLPVPKTLGEAGPADQMMWEWKNQGKNWEEIRAEWKKITGVEPGGSSLSVRYIKLVENLARNGAAGDLELLRFRKEAEEELLSQLWYRVAEKMVEFSPESEHNPKDLQKRYNMIVRSGYDVEKLLAEDKAKREIDQEPQSPCPEVNKYKDAFDVTMDNISTYDDPIANETAAQIRQNRPGAVGGSSVYDQHSHSGLSTPRNSADVYESVGMLRHEVDGFNERGAYHNIEGQVIDRRHMEALMSSTATLLTSPLISHGDTSGQADGISSTSAFTLIPYHSDSE